MLRMFSALILVMLSVAAVSGAVRLCGSWRNGRAAALGGHRFQATSSTIHAGHVDSVANGSAFRSGIAAAFVRLR
jgi:hypothetical protein